MAKNLTTIGFDADDTLWHNERFFKSTQDRFALLLADYAEQDHLAERLLAAEKRNIGHYGFGIKGFVLSMIETAIEVTDERVPARVIADIIESGRAMLAHPIDLLPFAQDAIEALAPTHRIILITKGDILDQERKLAQSGLGDMFDWVEIVAHKTPDTYRHVFSRHGDGANRALMVGNSMRSDIVPAITAGAWGVYVPHGLVWALEHAEPPIDAPRYRELASLEGLANFVQSIG